MGAAFAAELRDRHGAAVHRRWPLSDLGISGFASGKTLEAVHAATSARPLTPLDPDFETVVGVSSRGEAARWDDLAREVYCVLGIPIDAIDMPALISAVENAAVHKTPFLISTVNLNYLVTSQRDPEFHQSLLCSNLCPADGMPIIWIARLLRIPIKHRVAGSDLFATINATTRARRLKVFLFGGTETAAAAAASAINRSSGGWRCVGHFCPGFGSAETMGQDDVIDAINTSGADFLLTALGSRKGQIWLLRNHDRLQIPVRAHLGATLHFSAGTIRRAPAIAAKLGLEWLWRIKEEPHLWRRYWRDGVALLGLMYRHVLPLALRTHWQHWFGNKARQDLIIEQAEASDSTVLHLSGAAVAANVAKATSAIRQAVASKRPMTINLAKTSVIDARFLGLLLMLKKRLNEQGGNVKFVGVSARLKKMFDRNGAEFLLGAR
jgi:N-acetylglucosaminyldiphosphoundecaprenol N-acetyl-beta-D-mannosaminyltransferase